MKNKNCVKVGTDGQTAKSLVSGESPATEAVKRSRVPLYRVMLDRTGSIVKEGTAIVTQAREAAGCSGSSSAMSRRSISR